MTNPEATPGSTTSRGLSVAPPNSAVGPAGMSPHIPAGSATEAEGEIRVWTVSLALSLVLHAALMAAGIAVVWRIHPSDPADASGSLAWLDDDTTSIEPETLPRPPSPTSEPVSPSIPHEPATGNELLESFASDSALDPLDAPAAARSPAGVVRAAPLRGLAAAPDPAASHNPLASSPIRRSIPSDDSADPGLARSGARVRFAGLGAARARSVVYVVDASGPMVTSLAAVVTELTRSVARLEPSQRFTVVFFRELNEEGSGATRYSSFRPALVRATSKNTSDARAWAAAIRPGGRSNPLDGLRAALALKPDVVFLLSRSIERSAGGVWGAGKERILAELESLNPIDPLTGRRATLIRTIQFLDEDPTGIMQAIAAAHGSGDAAEGYRVVPPGTELRRD